MLTKKQEDFAKAIVEGMNQADAYRTAYNAKNMSDNASYREASLLMNNPKVAQRISELRAELAQDTILTARERLEWLSKLILSEEVSIGDKLKASDQMNKMQGEYMQRFSGDLNLGKLEDLL